MRLDATIDCMAFHVNRFFTSVKRFEGRSSQRSPRSRLTRNKLVSPQTSAPSRPLPRGNASSQVEIGAASLRFSEASGSDAAHSVRARNARQMAAHSIACATAPFPGVADGGGELGAKAAGGCRTPKAGAPSNPRDLCEASWIAGVPCRFWLHFIRSSLLVQRLFPCRQIRQLDGLSRRFPSRRP